MTETWTADEYRDYLQKGVRPAANKYGAQKTMVDDITFDSKKEAKRYAELKLLRKAGTITGLCRQVQFDLKGVVYRADFVYFNIATGQFVVEDSKGFRTKEYKIKKRLMKEILSLEVVET